MMTPQGTILRTKIESRPQELCPDVIANRTRGDAQLVFEAARRCKHPLWIEASFHPSPLLGLAEAATQHPQKGMFAGRFPGFSRIFERNVEILATKVADAHLVHCGYKFCCQFSREL